MSQEMISYDGAQVLSYKNGAFFRIVKVRKRRGEYLVSKYQCDFNINYLNKLL